MDSGHENDSVVYVTLREAANEIGGSAEDLRKAVRQQQIKGVKEDPENKRSRWLVDLEDVRSLYQTEPSESSESPSGILEQDGSPVVNDEHPPDDTEPPIRTDFTETSEPEMPSTADYEVVPDPAPMEMVPEMVGDQLGRLPSNQRDGMPPSIAAAIPGRGEELIERLTEAIDRFSDRVPEELFDYQAFLDKYVVAVEKGAEAEVCAATLQRRIDDLRDQAATTAQRLEQAQAQNRQLLAELEIARAELDAVLHRGPVDETRPLWKRRNRE
jgi:hypothetical protein